MWRTLQVLVLFLVACRPPEAPECAGPDQEEAWAKVEECAAFAGRGFLLDPDPACRACVLDAHCGVLAAKGACVDECGGAK